MTPEYYYSTDLDVPVEDNAYTREPRQEFYDKKDRWDDEQFWEDDLD